MEQNSQAKKSNSRETILESQLRECYGRVVYSHKTHEKCADILLSRLSTIKIWQMILSACATGGFIVTLIGPGQIGSIIGVILSTILLVLSAYTKNYDLGELAQKHKQSANEIWLIREKYLTLLTDLSIGDKPLGSIQEQRDELLELLHAIYTGSPSTTHEAYRSAQNALQTKEDLTFTSEEIDQFLPMELRRG
ncbi:MAG: hypothetical protein ACJAS1_005419 [Oleiphilaceae bacterium]|jgi:hypothetical protein